MRRFDMPLIASLLFATAIGALLALQVRAPARTGQTPPTQVKTGAAPSRMAAFGEQTELRLGEAVAFEDGLRMKLARIDDSRCPANAQCIWQGELAPLLELTGGGIGANPSELSLGTSRSRQASTDGYELTLIDATAAEATIRVDKTQPVSGSGIRGTVMIGPSCPAPRLPSDPDCADKPYQTTLRITGKLHGGMTPVKTDADGAFFVSLPPGDYIVSPSGKNASPWAAAQDVTVVQGKVTEIVVRFDSGIR